MGSQFEEILETANVALNSLKLNVSTIDEARVVKALPEAMEKINKITKKDESRKCKISLNLTAHKRFVKRSSRIPRLKRDYFMCQFCEEVFKKKADMVVHIKNDNLCLQSFHQRLNNEAK